MSSSDSNGDFFADFSEVLVASTKGRSLGAVAVTPVLLPEGEEVVFLGE